MEEWQQKWEEAQGSRVPGFSEAVEEAFAGMGQAGGRRGAAAMIPDKKGRVDRYGRGLWRYVCVLLLRRVFEPISSMCFPIGLTVCPSCVFASFLSFEA